MEPLNEKEKTQLLAKAPWQCPSTSLHLFMDSSLCLFPNSQQIPALGPVREHSSQRLLSFFAPFQNFNLISLSVFMSLFLAQQTGPLFFFSIALTLRQRPGTLLLLVLVPLPLRPGPGLRPPRRSPPPRDSSGGVKRAHSWAPPQRPFKQPPMRGLDPMRADVGRSSGAGGRSSRTFSQPVILPGFSFKMWTRSLELRRENVRIALKRLLIMSLNKRCPIYRRPPNLNNLTRFVFNKSSNNLFCWGIIDFIGGGRRRDDFGDF